MSFMRHLWYLSLASFVLSVFGSRRGVQDIVYKTFDSSNPCFRLVNGTHQFGCSSPKSGSYGVIQPLWNDTDVDHFLNNAAAGPYVVILEPSMFVPVVLDKLRRSDKVNGMILSVAPYAIPPQHYSLDDTCPNRYFDLDACSGKVPWNPYGNFLILSSWDIPVFFVKNETTIKEIYECHRKFNLPVDGTQSSRPLCSLHLKSHMYAARSSEVCVRRQRSLAFSPMKYCDPLGDRNVILPMSQWEDRENSVIIVAARLDTSALFFEVPLGAMTAYTGLVTLLTTAQLLKNLTEVRTSETPKKPGTAVIFMLFNGESYDYIGSSRVAFEMENGDFILKDRNLSFDHLKMYIELAQIGSKGETYLHSFGETSDMVSNIMKSSTSVKFKNSSSSVVPPSSFLPFRRVKNNLPGIIISNYDTSFVNRYYNSFFDTKENLDPQDDNYEAIIKNIAGVADALSLALAKEIGGSSVKDFSTYHGSSPDSVANATFHCYMDNGWCPQFEKIAVASDIQLSKDTPLSSYVAVPQVSNKLTDLTALLLASYTADDIDKTKEECSLKSDPNKWESYIWLGRCLVTTMTFTPAVSPAFLMEEYDWSSHQYSTWMESVWDGFDLQMFLKPNRSHELIIFFSGLSMFVVSLGVVYAVKSKSSMIFRPHRPVDC